MKLKDKIKELDPNELVCISSKSAYFFIGYPNDFFRQLDSLNKKWKLSYERSIETMEKKVRIARDEYNKMSVQNDGTLDRSLKKANKAVSDAIINLERAKERNERFKPFEERRVTEVYRSLYNDKTIVHVTGDEHGPYWVYSEVLKKKHLFEGIDGKFYKSFDLGDDDDDEIPETD